MIEEMGSSQSQPRSAGDAEPSAAIRIGPIWSCKVGTDAGVLLPPGCDAPMRRAVKAAFVALAGVEPDFTFSGWGGQLTEPERAVVDNRLPTPEYEREQRLIAAAPEALKRMVDWYGKRTGVLGADDLLPPEQQEPEVQRALAALSKAEGK